MQAWVIFPWRKIECWGWGKIAASDLHRDPAAETPDTFSATIKSRGYLDLCIDENPWKPRQLAAKTPFSGRSDLYLDLSIMVFSHSKMGSCN